MSDSQGGPVPKRWLHCPRKSVSFIADKFLAFKTPLSDAFDIKLPIDCQFRPEMIFSYMKKFQNIKLGMWIDLTNTKRFYDRRSVEVNNARYIKMQCRGHGETPSPTQTQSFIELVDAYILENPLNVIGVHCTHGFNRTGFLIVSYMVEKMDCSVEAAIKAFAEARPPGIYKQDYINELFKRYEDEDDAIMAPELPDWCFDEEDEDDGGDDDQHNSSKRALEDDQNGSAADPNGIAESSGQSSKNARKRRKTEYVNPNATFMIGVPGVILVTDQPRVGELQALVQDMCGWKRNGFPGCQPVSMDIDNIKLLHTKPYRVSWKADGTRYMMLIKGENEVYFFDRNHACFQVERLRFVKPDNLNEHLTNTLLDGEMVIDKYQGQNIPRFLVYDIVRYENVLIGNQPFFPDRQNCIKKKVIEPRYEAMKRGLINKQREPFSVRDKAFWEVTQAGALLSPKFAKTLSHEPDGLIFQPSRDPYMTGRCDVVLKWKPLTMNSVDFKLKISEESGVGILKRKIGLLYVGQLDAPFAQMKYTKDLKELDNKIIECKYEKNNWVFMRERTDKSMPNSYDTAIGVWKSIKTPVTTAILLDFIGEHRFVEDCEIMPPPPGRF